MNELPSRPELQMFADPAVDRVMGVVFSLAGELQVLRDRVQVLEAMLADRGVIEAGAIDRHAPDAALQAALDADRRAYTRHVFDPMLGRAASRSAVGEGHGTAAAGAHDAAA